MLIKLERLIPSMFADKATGLDELQAAALPDSERRAIIHGSPEEAVEAFKNIQKREERYGGVILGQGAKELLGDQRFVVKGNEVLGK